jgi:hypothetical protein
MQEDEDADCMNDKASIDDAREAKVHLFQMFDDEIAWRVEAFLQQIPGQGPIPFLVAREAIGSGPNCCHSCGEALIDCSGYVCGPCSRAKDRALEIAMSKL